MNLPAPAVVWIAKSDAIYTRIAAFTWQTPTGIAWLETGYLHDGTQAFHTFEGRVNITEKGTAVTGSDGQCLLFSQQEALADPDLCPPDLREGLQGVQEEFADLGLDWAAEFARMTQMLGSEIGLS